jgi:hypothetical protein
MAKLTIEDRTFKEVVSAVPVLKVEIFIKLCTELCQQNLLLNNFRIGVFVPQTDFDFSVEVD